MNCEQQKQIELYLLDELSEAEAAAFEEHCWMCQTCSEQLLIVGESIVDMDSPDDQSSFDTCFAAVQNEIRHIRKSRWKVIGKRLRMPLRIAAAVTLLGGAVALWSINRDSELKLTVNWKQDGNLLTTQNDRPVIRDGKVFTLRKEDGSNFLLALNKVDGSVVWKRPIGKATRLVADDHCLYAGQLSEGIFSITALAVTDGNPKWTVDHAFKSGFRKNLTFQIANGRLNWISERSLNSFDTADGSLLWKTRLTNRRESFALPVTYNDTLILTGSSNLYTINNATGEIISKRKHPESFNFFMRPKVTTAGSLLYVASNVASGKGKLGCYNLNSGALEWNRSVDNVRKMQASHGLLIVKNKKLEAYDQQTGELVWTDPVGGCYEIAFHKNNIFAINSTKKHDIIALDARSGNRIKSFAVSGQSCSGISIVGNDGFLTTNDGNLYAMSF